MTDSGAESGAGAGDLTVEVTFNESLQRFEAHLPGEEEVAYINVRPGTKTWAFVHTEVPASFRGRGVGSLLVSAALDHVRQLGVKVRPLCPFVVQYLRENPEALDAIEPSSRRHFK